MNLLIVIADEHRRDAMGCAGHPVVTTPHLDALAARGTRFTNAYTPSPMCVPTRAAIATGQPIHRSGHWDSATPYAGKPESWMHLVRDAVIPTISIGKLHFRSAEEDTGWPEQILPMHVVDGEGWVIGLLRENPPSFEGTAELAADVGAGESSYTEYDRAVTCAAVDWLRRHAAQGPWAAWVSLVAPHYPLICPEPFLAPYREADLPLPAGAGRPLPDHPEIARLMAFFDYHRHFDADRARQARAAYFGLTSFMDHNLGRILGALEATGALADTRVIYCSDHGDMLGDLGLRTKQTMYESSVGVPLIVAGAAAGAGPGAPRGGACTTGASLTDLATTALATFDLPVPPEMQGVDLTTLALKNGTDRTILSEYHDGGSTTGTFMVRWDRWKYVHYVGERPQLFDLAADPTELTDFGASPAHLEVRPEGEARLRAMCDPEAVNAWAFADQRAKNEALGGEAACHARTVFNHTPTPLS